jgi:membrane protease YdiL (CAAX protease family)
VLIPPVAVSAVLLTLRTLLSPAFSPHLFPLGILFGLVPGFVEEIGWSGYVFPRMQERYGSLRGSLLLGVLWGLWHLPVINYLGAAYPHGSYWLPYALAFIVAMTAMRVLIAWVYTNTTSILLAGLMHVSSTASLVVLGPSPISPAQEALWYAVYALVLWGIVAVIVAIYGSQLMRQPVLIGHPKEARAWKE